jgi:hypothetical protein
MKSGFIRRFTYLNFKNLLAKILHYSLLDFWLDIIESLFAFAFYQLADFGWGVQHGFDLELTDADFFDQMDHVFNFRTLLVSGVFLHVV